MQGQTGVSSLKFCLIQPRGLFLLFFLEFQRCNQKSNNVDFDGYRIVLHDRVTCVFLWKKKISIVIRFHRPKTVWCHKKRAYRNLVRKPRYKCLVLFSNELFRFVSSEKEILTSSCAQCFT